jgi:sortase A
VDTSVLSNAVGHVPTTAPAGDPGNFAIAAHRDTLFRALKDVREGDLVAVETPKRRYTYRVFSMRIVKPSEVSVLRPDGGLNGAHTENVSMGTDGAKLITLITCYPFYYVGSAPKRFIVQGEMVSQAAEPGAASPPNTRTVPKQTARTVHKPRRARGSFRLQTAAVKSTQSPPKKRRLWKRLLHVS